VPRLVGNVGWIVVTVVTLNPASCDNLLVEKSLLASAIVRWQFQESAYALQMLSEMVWLQSGPFGDWQLPEPSIRLCSTSYISHGRNWLCPTIPVASILQASSASAENSPCGAILGWRLCPSPCQVHHHTACRALYHLPHLPRLPHPAHCRKLQDHSDCLQ